MVDAKKVPVLFALVMIILISCIRSGILIKLIRMTIEEKDSTTSPLQKLAKSYRRNYWYWEFVILSRRIFLVDCLIYDNYNYLYLDMCFNQIIENDN